MRLAKRLFPAPNFKFVGLKRRPFFVNPDPHLGVHEPTSDKEFESQLAGFVAQFTNVAQNGTSKDGYEVIAKLRFFSDNWVSSKDIEYAVWIASSRISTTIAFGHTEELFLLAQLDGDGEKFCLRDRRKNFQYYKGEQFSYVEAVPIEGFPYVQIVLVDGMSHVSQSWVFRLDIHGSSIDCREAYPPKTAGMLPH